MHKDVQAADRDADAAERSAADHARAPREAGGRARGGARVPRRSTLQIEQTRFADRLVVRFDVQPETLDCLRAEPASSSRSSRTPSSTAWRGKAGTGHIDISARRDGDKLWLEVRDDGVGLSEDALTALQKGIGVSTTRARLQHLFGADYRFEFHRLAQGLAVIVAIPWRTEPRRCRRRRGRSPTTPRRVGGMPAVAATARRDARASQRRSTLNSLTENSHEKNQDARSRTTSRSPRERLASLLSTRTGYRVRRPGRDGEEAITAIHDHTPDLVFLDVQMPQMNGFEVIEAVGTDKMPLVIFVTAYDQHALQGVPGAGARLPAQAVRPRALHRGAPARPQADRARRDRRPRAPAAGAGQGSAAGSAASPIGWWSSPAAGCSSCARTRSTGSKRPATTSASTSARRRTCCAKR